MVNSEFSKDIAKGINKYKINQKLEPGSTPRRYEPECGIRKHSERIHRESKYADQNMNLPFSFKKPPKPRGRSVYVACDRCGHITSATTVTVGVICSKCKVFSTVSEVNFDW
jgi:ribosomal protein S27E